MGTVSSLCSFYIIWGLVLHRHIHGSLNGWIIKEVHENTQTLFHILEIFQHVNGNWSNFKQMKYPTVSRIIMSKCRTYLDLHLQMCLEVWQQSKEYRKRQLKNFWNRWDSIFWECNTQILLNSINKHLICSENRSCILQNG